MKIICCYQNSPPRDQSPLSYVTIHRFGVTFSFYNLRKNTNYFHFFSAGNRECLNSSTRTNIILLDCLNFFFTFQMFRFYTNEIFPANILPRSATIKISSIINSKVSKKSENSKDYLVPCSRCVKKLTNVQCFSLQMGYE